MMDSNETNEIKMELIQLRKLIEEFEDSEIVKLAVEIHKDNRRFMIQLCSVLFPLIMAVGALWWNVVSTQKAFDQDRKNLNQKFDQEMEKIDKEFSNSLITDIISIEDPILAERKKFALIYFIGDKDKELKEKILNFNFLHVEKTAPPDMLSSQCDDEPSDLLKAACWEESGFSFLKRKDLDNAILAFNKSKDILPTFHKVSDISNFLSLAKQDYIEIKNSSGSESAVTQFPIEYLNLKLWDGIYDQILSEYSWGMTENNKIEIENAKPADIPHFAGLEDSDLLLKNTGPKDG